MSCAAPQAPKADTAGISLPPHHNHSLPTTSDGGASVVDAAINIPDQSSSAAAALDPEQGLCGTAAAAATSKGAGTSNCCQADALRCKDTDEVLAATAGPAGSSPQGTGSDAASEGTGACRCCGGTGATKEEVRAVD